MLCYNSKDQTAFLASISWWKTQGPVTHAPPQACLPLNITMCHSTEVKVSPSELPLTGIKGQPDAAGKQRERKPQVGLQTG